MYTVSVQNEHMSHMFNILTYFFSHKTLSLMIQAFSVCSDGLCSVATRHRISSLIFPTYFVKIKSNARWGLLVAQHQSSVWHKAKHLQLTRHNFFASLWQIWEDNKCSTRTTNKWAIGWDPVFLIPQSWLVTRGWFSWGTSKNRRTPVARALNKQFA